MLIHQLDSSSATAYKAIRLEALRECPAAFNSSYEEEKERPLSDFADLLQLTLVVNTTNTSAISLYESFGFKMFGIEPFAALIDGVPQEQMHMVRLEVDRASDTLL